MAHELACLNLLTAPLPKERGRSYCENEAVSVIVSHYAAQAEAKAIRQYFLAPRRGRV